MKSSNVYDSDYSDSLSPSDSLDPKRSKSIKIVKRLVVFRCYDCSPRGRAFSSSYRGITEDSIGGTRSITCSGHQRQCHGDLRFCWESGSVRVSLSTK